MRFLKVCTAALLLTMAAQARADHSSPKSAALSFAEAITKGDKAVAQEYVNGTEDDKKVVGTMADMIAAVKKLETAAVAKLGDGAKNVGQMASMDEMVNSIKGVEATETGDTATLQLPGQAEPMHLIRVDGKWLVDFEKMEERDSLAQAAPMFTAMTQVAGEIAANVENGQYKTVEELQQAFGTRMMEVLSANIPHEDHTGHDHGEAATEPDQNDAPAPEAAEDAPTTQPGGM